MFSECSRNVLGMFSECRLHIFLGLFFCEKKRDNRGPRSPPLPMMFGYLTLAKMYAAGTIWCGFVSAKFVKNCIWKMGMIIKHFYLFVTFNDQAYILLTLF
jgi:hypothetical protein